MGTSNILRTTTTVSDTSWRSKSVVIPKFFAIEGLSASGKSTVFDLLRNRSEFVGVPSIPAAFESVRTAFSALEHRDARFLYFSSALAFTATIIDRHLRDGHNVIVESFIYRTISFHKGFGATVGVIWPRDMRCPDRVFFLHCDETVRQTRLRARVRPPCIWRELAEKNLPQIINEYSRWEMTKIDTSTLMPEDVAKRIVGEL